MEFTVTAVLKTGYTYFALKFAQRRKIAWLFGLSRQGDHSVHGALLFAGSYTDF